MLDASGTERFASRLHTYLNKRGIFAEDDEGDLAAADGTGTGDNNFEILLTKKVNQV